MNKINVTRPSMPQMNEYFEEIAPLWESRWLTHMGVKHTELEKKLCKYLSVENISLFTNGHLALEKAIAAMRLSGNVITTPFTFASTTQAIVQNGLTPIFCDVNPTDFTIDVSKIEELIDENTSAIVAVHVYGNVCNVDAIEKIAAKHRLAVIYDAAHAFGVRVGERGIGSFGDASMFSFHATKVFNTIEGGCIAYRDSSLTDRLQSLKYYGMAKDGSYPEIAGNAKMDEFRAAMGLCNLRHVDEEIAKRKAAVKRYRENLVNIHGLTVWQEQPGVTHNYAYFPIICDEKKFGLSRDEIADKLAKENIFARKYFYPLTSHLECYSGKFQIKPTPVAEMAASQVLTLPLYADLNLEDVDRICKIILK